MSFGRAPSYRGGVSYADAARLQSTMAQVPMPVVSDDIKAEAVRRIAEAKQKDEEAKREKSILDTMKAIEYEALPKCAHGVVSDMKAYAEYSKKYEHHVVRHGCLSCQEECRLQKEKEVAEKAAAEARIAKAKRAVELAEQQRQHDIAIQKLRADKTLSLNQNSAVLNFTGFNGSDRHETVVYLRKDGDRKYVPIQESLDVHPQSLLGIEPSSDTDGISTVTTPTHWTTHFTEGLIPFLPMCPFCSDETVMYAVKGESMWRGTNAGARMHTCYKNYIDNVQSKCGKYKWVAETGKHYKNGSEWDPSDPDGSKAAHAKRVADIATMEAQVVALQAKIAEMKAI